jgi:hypothetical protein
MSSFGFSIDDFVTLGMLAMELGRADASAPEEHRSVMGDLEVFGSLIAQFRRDVLIPTSPLNQCSQEQQVQLSKILKHVNQVLESLQGICDKFSSFQSQPGVWDRPRFPSAQVRASQAQLRRHISALKLFLESLNLVVLGTIMTVLGVLEEQGRLAQENWATLVLILKGKGIGEEMKAP